MSDPETEPSEGDRRAVRGLVLDVDRFASHDGPGIRTVVFLKGCPLACRWCHSPESQAAKPQVLYQAERCIACGLCFGECPEGALSADEADSGGRAAIDRSRCTACGRCVEVCYPGALRLAGRPVSAAELASSIARDLPYFRASGGGMTLSGGEPTQQPEFSCELLRACRRDGIDTALETCGYAPWETLAEVASAADLVLYDVKHMDSAAHARLTGAPNDVILANLERLAASHPAVQVRVPCIAGVNDDEPHIARIAAFVAGLGIGELTLLPYNAAAAAKYRWIGRRYPLEGTQAQSGETMDRLAAVGRASGLDIRIGG